MIDYQILKLINRLKEIIDSYNENMLNEFEDLLFNIHSSGNPEIISKLINLMKDSFEFDELMFSIIHTIENFEDKIYVVEVLKTLPQSIEKNPRWFSIIMMRIINSKECKSNLINLIEKLSFIQKEALLKLLLSMGNSGGEVMLKVMPIIQILKKK